MRRGYSAGVIALRPKPWQWFCVALVYYSFAITTGSFGLFAPVDLGMVFNSMLDSLLHGRFDIDPEVIRAEGFVRDGKSYAYFGVLPALLRAPLLLGGLLDTVDFTTFSCVIAAALAAYFKVSILAVFRKVIPATFATDVVIGTVVMATIFGGPQVQFLKASIYQETALWGAALAAGYLFIVIRCLVEQRTFSKRSLAWMSLLAGLSLITRVSVGMGLYLSTGFLLLVLAYRQTYKDRPRRAVAFIQALFGTAWRPAWAILLFFVLAAGMVNYGRFGNPTTFADLRLNGEMQLNPMRMSRLLETGEINPKRIGYAVLYYFVPITMARAPDGGLILQDFQARMVDPPELPPSSFFLSDPLLMVLAGIAAWTAIRFRRWGEVRIHEPLSILAGLTAPPLVVCMAIYLAFRYRLDFYPFFDLLAFLGLYAFLQMRTLSPPWWPRLGKLIEYSALLQIAASHLFLILYKVSPFGDQLDIIAREGILNLYMKVFALPF
jgi:hypothetical protein